MDATPTRLITPYRRSLSTPHVKPSILSAFVFGFIIASLILLGLYCRFWRGHSISESPAARLAQILYADMPSTYQDRPANVSLPVMKYSKEGIGADGDGISEGCPVCLMEFEEGEEVKVVVPGCEHVFHPVCIDRWLAMRDTCPVCRLTVGEETNLCEIWVEGGGDEVEEGVESMIVSEERDGGQGADGEGNQAVVNLVSMVIGGVGDESEREGETTENANSVLIREKNNEDEKRVEVSVFGTNLENERVEENGEKISNGGELREERY